jgi:hypothetical protein
LSHPRMPASSLIATGWSGLSALSAPSCGGDSSYSAASAMNRLRCGPKSRCMSAHASAAGELVARFVMASCPTG